MCGYTSIRREAAINNISKNPVAHLNFSDEKYTLHILLNIIQVANVETIKIAGLNIVALKSIIPFILPKVTNAVSQKCQSKKDFSLSQFALIFFPII
jgi:hypothetical protein